MQILPARFGPNVLAMCTRKKAQAAVELDHSFPDQSSTGLRSVTISEAMAVFIFRTERGWFGIVDAMRHRCQRSQIRNDRNFLILQSDQAVPTEITDYAKKTRVVFRFGSISPEPWSGEVTHVIRSCGHNCTPAATPGKGYEDRSGKV